MGLRRLWRPIEIHENKSIERDRGRLKKTIKRLERLWRPMDIHADTDSTGRDKERLKETKETKKIVETYGDTGKDNSACRNM